MINFPFLTMQKFLSLTVIIFSGLLLQACGGQRDEPFNADSSSSSSTGDAIELVNLTPTNHSLPYMNVDFNSKLTAIGDSVRFQTSWFNYTNTDADSSLKFTEGQVILIDAGRLTACDAKSSVVKVEAYETSDNRIKVVVDYADTGSVASSATSSVNSSTSSSNSSSLSSSSSSSASSCANGSYVQNFYFYYVKSRKTVFFEENVN